VFGGLVRREVQKRTVYEKGDQSDAEKRRE